MDQDRAAQQIRNVGDGSGFDSTGRFYQEEVQLALRNRGMPMEALRYPLTPVGLHYLLVHYDIPDVDAAQWRLRLGGLVDRPLTLSLDDIRSRPAQTLAVTMECAGNGRGLMAPRRLSHPWLGEAIGTAEWTGAPLRSLLDEAGLRPEAVEIVFTGLDRGIEGHQVQAYQRSLSLADAGQPEVLLAYAMNGEPLQPQHGYPLRLVVPGWYGMTSVKWLDQIEAVAEPFQGFQMSHAYRYAQTPDWAGEPVNLIRVRALMIPPGIPDYMTRTRLVAPGRVTLRGAAWAGRHSVARVEVSADGGQSWAPAEVGEALSPFAWASWSSVWDAQPGPATLCARATDSAGHTQPLEAAWNFGGYGNNAVQRVEVIVAYDPLAATRELWDRAAATFDEEPDHGLRDPATRRAWTALMARVLPAQPATILDTGCGTGSLSVLMAGLGHAVTGIDLSPAMIARARVKAAAAEHSIDFQIMDAAQPSLTPGQFDVIVCRHLLWALPQPAAVLERWAGLLRPEGRLVLIEGRWGTGAGLHASEILAALPPALAAGPVMALSEQAALWGRPVTDERYAIVADLRQ